MEEKKNELESLINELSSSNEKEFIMLKIGKIYYDQRNYDEALKYYQESLEIKKQTLPENDLSIANLIQ